MDVVAGYGECEDCNWYHDSGGCDVERDSRLCRLNKKPRVGGIDIESGVSRKEYAEICNDVDSTITDFNLVGQKPVWLREVRR
jgi:hypothetical protein